MPALPPELFDDLLEWCTPLFRLPEERDGLLLPVLSAWSGFGRIDWSGSANTFAARLIYNLPGPELQRMLRSLGRQGDGERGEALSSRVTAALAQKESAGAGLLGRHYRETVERLSAPRYQLDRRFVNLTLLLDQGPEAMGTRFISDAQRPQYTSLATLLGEIDERAVVLLGRPGSGKTTLLRRLELERAWQALAADSEADDPIPFFASLGSFRAEDPRDPPPTPGQWLAAEWALRRPDLEPFNNYLRRGRLLLLLDGLNEMPYGDADEYAARVEQWRAFLPGVVACGNQVVFTCRSLEYSAPLGSEAVPVRQVQVEPLSPEQIEAFLTAHLAGQGTTVWTALREDEAQVDLFSTPFFLRLLVDQIGPAGEIPAGRAALLTGFVRQALRREIVEHGQRLLAADTLLSANDRQQILHDAWANPYDLPSDGPLIPLLEMLAYRMQDARRAGEAGGVRVAEQSARAMLLKDPWVETPSPGDALTAGLHLSVLDKDLAKREIFFFHQLFQEYFAARALAQIPEPDRLTVAWHVGQVSPSLDEVISSLTISDPLPGLPTTGWEETMLMAAPMTTDREQFVARLMPNNLPLAARCAAAPEVSISPELVAALQGSLLARVADPQADLRARIDAAEALGELGDPRYKRRTGPHGYYLLPPFVPVPAGTYTLGDDDGLYKAEKPAHPVPVAAFEMAAFPLTNAEYRLFVRAGGYEDESWWETEAAREWRVKGGGKGRQDSYRDFVNDTLRSISDEAIRTATNLTPELIDFYLEVKHLDAAELDRRIERWFPVGVVYRQPEYWDDSRFNHPARPVVGLTWFEARAYCAWLSAQTGEAYGLPTEAEWEAAARGAGGRAYAYGPAYDAAAGNTFESHIRRTTPIGVFPAGRTPEGIYDLSGNVWEWTTTVFRPYPYDAADGREEAEDAAARRVLRGGSWLLNRNLARAVCRDDSLPFSRNSNVGCRLVRRPPSQAL